MAEEEYSVDQDQLYVPENILFWYERLCTIILTPSWIYGCYCFLVKSEESQIFKTAAMISYVFMSATNVIYFVSYLLRSPFVKKAMPAIAGESTIRKKWHDVECLAFWNERVGMLFVVISVITLPPYSTALLLCSLPCIILFPFANILYFEWFFIFGENVEEYEDEPKEVKNKSGSKKLEGKKGEIDDALSKEKVAKSPICERTMGVLLKDGDNVSGTKLESCDNKALKGMETVKIHENDRAYEGLPKLEAVQESEEKKGNNGFGQQADNKLPLADQVQESEEKKGNNEFGQQADNKVPLADQVKEMNTSEAKCKKKCEILEKKWEKKLKNMKERYKEDREKWKQQEQELFSTISSASSQAGFYQVQASESEEKLRRLEEEKNELITKLITANAASELYRSLLHEPCWTQDCCPSFSGSRTIK